MKLTFFSLGAQNSSLTWGGQLHQLDILNLSLISNHDEFLKHGKLKYNLTSPLKPRSRFLMRSHVVDNKGCRGRDTEFSILGINSHLLFIYFVLIEFLVPGDEEVDSEWTKEHSYLVSIGGLSRDVIFLIM